MISIESHPVIFKRALFNRPYRTVEVIEGDSADIIPSLLERNDLVDRPWVVWLDHDKEMTEERIDELIQLIRGLPPNSFLLTTFGSMGSKYGSVPERPERIRRLFGAAAPDNLRPSECRDEGKLDRILAQATEDLLLSTAIQSARPGTFLPAINLTYKDSVPMATVGGFLPIEENYEAAKAIITAPGWPGRVERLIEAPPLTTKEIQALQSRLPSDKVLTREDVAEIGFDLEDAQLTSYVAHYLRYPQFAQVAR